MAADNMATNRANPQFPPLQPTPGFPYRIVGPAGQGAMGAVYRAEEPELERPVAIKVIRPAFLRELSRDAARSVRRRFLQEARAAAKLSHPSVVTIYRVGTERGWPYIAMEWLDALSVEDWLRTRGTLSATLVVKLALAVLDALDSAHEQGIIHRDIKPGNIMISADEKIKIVDFGIARMRDSNLARTMPGQVLGTPWYAAPEQLASEPLDRRADLYGLSAVLYEALVGEAPYSQDSLIKLLHAHQNSDVVPVHQRVAQVPRALSDIISRGLQKDPDHRFPNARAMAQAIIALQDTGAAAMSGSGSMRASRRTQIILPDVTMERLGEFRTPAMVIDYARTWTERHVGAIGRDDLIREISDRPLHADPFCGAVEASGIWLLVAQGLIHTAFDPEGQVLGDAAIESLPAICDATLYSAPRSLAPGTISLLAAALQPGPVEQGPLDSMVSDLVELQDRLQRDDFDGLMRLSTDEAQGWVFFRQGQRILDIFGGDWEGADDGQRWEEWIDVVSATATVERRKPRFPAVTFRQQLQGLRLIVERPDPLASSSVREDAVTEAQAIALVPSRQSREELSRGKSTIGHLVRSDPAWRLARYAVGALPLQFEQHGRDDRWRRLLASFPEIDSVILHDTLAVGDGDKATFDAVTCDGQGRRRHLLDQIALGSADAVEAFVKRVMAVKCAGKKGAHIDGAVLMAPRFDDDALQRWMALQDEASGGIFRSAIDSWTHQEGIFYCDGGPLHILLVEDAEGQDKRPLMPA